MGPCPMTAGYVRQIPASKLDVTLSTDVSLLATPDIGRARVLSGSSVGRHRDVEVRDERDRRQGVSDIDSDDSF